MFDDLGPKSIAICGAGLVGCLHGLYLKQKHGYNITFYESRQDPRLWNESGRSINLVITSRGINALTGLSDELAERVMNITTRVDGRTIHNMDGTKAYQAYGPSSDYCNFSVSRSELNILLMNAAEEAGCIFNFEHPVSHVDIPAGMLYFYIRNPITKAFYQKSVLASHIFGGDGGGSRCRLALKGLLKDSCTEECLPLGHGYKELSMPVGEDNSSQLDPDSLHIWPRGSHFVMGLADLQGSMTMTLYMSDNEMNSVKKPEEIEEFFTKYYPSAISLMPDYIKDFMSNPNGFLGTVFASPWIYEDKLCLIGDAAHAVTPFFGQGCNSGFEDVTVFDQILTKHKNNSNDIDMGKIFAEFYASRKPNTDALANMCLENFTEMMAKTAEVKFLLEKDIEIAISKKFPAKFTSR
jgi:kynurenine 3-monooxygenase